MRALVTGAAGGIGSAIAAALEASGHTVLRHDVRAGDRIDVTGDLLDAQHLRDLAALGHIEGVDAVVVAHGVAAALRLALVDREYVDRAMGINTLSFLNLYDVFEEMLTERGGVFTAISSQAGLYGEADNGVYCASKFAIVGWAEGLRDVGRGPRIRILCPGATETPLLRAAFEGMAQSQGVPYEDILRTRGAKIPAGRLGKVSDIAAAAVWLSEITAPHMMIAPVTGGEVLV